MTDHATLCILSYNRPQFLPQCIETAREAGVPLEIIVHDDGSTNGELLSYLYQAHADGLISTLILNAPGYNQGVGNAIKRTFDMAAGDWVVKVDQDLIFKPGWGVEAFELMPPISGRLIPLEDAKGNVQGCTIVDAGDYAEASEYRWHLHPQGYAAAFADNRTTLMHRFLMDARPGDPQVDHENRRRLDNRRDNLRMATRQENQHNQTPQRGRTSEYRGVSWNTRERKWYVFQKLDGRQVYLGSYDDETVAAGIARSWREEHMPTSVEDVLPPEIGLLGLFKYWQEPVDWRKTLVAEHDGFQEHTHICGSAFVLRREVYEALGIGTHSEAFAEDWELMKLITDATPFVCALPDEDLVENVGFGIGPSTVVVGEGIVQKIQKEPRIYR